MSGVHLHLILNHAPVIGLIGALLLLLWGMARKSREVTFAALGVMVIVALVTIPVYLSGEPAEEAAEHLPGVTEDLIHEHEESAEFALIVTEVAGAIALIALIFSVRKPGVPRSALTVPVLLVALVAAGVIVRTAYLGGQIRHTEIRDGAAATTAVPAESGEKDDD